MWYLLLCGLLALGGPAIAYDQETERIKAEIADVVCRASFMCSYQKNVVERFTSLIERVEREQKENQQTWEKEKDEGSLIPFP